MDALQFPLRFINGSFATLSSTTDEYYAQLIALTMQTEPGELVLRPNYGVESPEFDAVQAAKFAQLVGQFFPDVIISDVTSRPLESGQVKIAVSFERKTS